jgi:hypothetical protein
MPGVVADHVAQIARDKEEYDRDYESFARFSAMAELEPNYECWAGQVGVNTYSGPSRTDLPKPVNHLSNEEIVREAQEIHSRFANLSEQYNEAPAGQRTEIREEMKPLVNRERELRQEYTGRTSQELALDRAPEEISYSR